MVCALFGCGLDVFLSGGDLGIGIASSSGDGIVCIFLELVPLRKENCGLDRFSGELVRSPGFLSSFRRAMTVPSRRNPKPRGLRSGAGETTCGEYGRQERMQAWGSIHREAHQYQLSQTRKGLPM